MTIARRAVTGLTLVELMVVLAVGAILAGVAVPSALAQMQKSRRLDAVASLTRVQFAQERFHALHGRYAPGLGQLVGAASPASDQGHYRIELVEVDATRYTAVAIATGAQAGDTACARISVVVDGGVADHRPGAACWNR